MILSLCVDDSFPTGSDEAQLIRETDSLLNLFPRAVIEPENLAGGSRLLDG